MIRLPDDGILYHGSYIEVSQIDLSKCKYGLDFGKGFYLTAIREQAIAYAERFTRRNKDAYINEYELDDETPGLDMKNPTIKSAFSITLCSSDIYILSKPTNYRNGSEQDNIADEVCQNYRDIRI